MTWTWALVTLAIIIMAIVKYRDVFRSTRTQQKPLPSKETQKVVEAITQDLRKKEFIANAQMRESLRNLAWRVILPGGLILGGWYLLWWHQNPFDTREPFTVTWQVSLDSKPIPIPKDANGLYRAEYPELSIAYNCLDQWGQFNLHGSQGKTLEGELVFNGYQRDGVEFYGQTVQIYPNLGPQACNYKEGEVRLTTNPTPTVMITFKPI